MSAGWNNPPSLSDETDRRQESRSRDLQETGSKGEREMKKLVALALGVAVMSPAVAFAGSGATNAALGLGAFAVFNQILGGVGLFGGLPPYAAPAPAYVAPPPVV